MGENGRLDWEDQEGPVVGQLLSFMGCALSLEKVLDARLESGVCIFVHDFLDDDAGMYEPEHAEHWRLKGTILYHFDPLQILTPSSSFGMRIEYELGGPYSLHFFPL